MRAFKRKSIAFIISIVIICAMLSLSWNKIFNTLGILPRLNYYLYDANLKWVQKNLDASNQIVVVDIDEKSLSEEGKWPWPRNKIAILLHNLHAAGAAVVAFDILFPEQDRNAAAMLLQHARKSAKTPKVVLRYLQAETPLFDNDAYFAKALAEGDNVLGVFFHDALHTSVGQLGLPIFSLAPDANLVVRTLPRYIGVIPALLSVAKHTGFTTTVPDSDGVLRRTPLLIRYDNALYPSLALEVARLYLLQDRIVLHTREVDKHKVLSGITLGNIMIPTDAAGNMLVLYRGPAYSFPYISAYKVLHGDFSAQQFSGKIVFVGSSAVGIGDTHATPLQSAAYPGVEVHANVAHAILHKDFVFSPVWAIGLERVFIVLLGVLLSGILLYCSPVILFLTIVLVEVLLVLVQIFSWTWWNFIWPHAILFYLLVLFIGVFHLSYAYFFEVRYRHKLRNLYGQYVSNKHLDTMLDNPRLYTQGGESKNMSVLFSDIRNFTAISEKLNAAKVQQFLNNLFTPLTEIIFNQKGTIDKYVGDMIVAFWNDPVPDQDHAQNAVLSALKMQAAMRKLAPMFAAQGLPEVRIGIGINTGMMHVGDMGSQYRRSYTVLGDAVNQASRFEAATKFYGVDIIVSESTKTASPNIAFRFIDKVKVKGKEEAVKIYEPLGLTAEITLQLQSELTQYEKALVAYYARDFVTAEKLFAALPSAALYQLYYTRARAFIQSPPTPDWDGVFERHEK